MGDIHGDYDNGFKILKKANIINAQGDWIAQDTILVQTGDIVDRGPDTIKLYQLFQRLEQQAPLKGGQVIVLLGNHEIMNMMEDYRYVDPRDMASFGSKEKRKQAWSPNGFVGKYLRRLNITTTIKGTVFVHAGIHPSFAKMSSRELNRRVNAFLNGESDAVGFKIATNENGPVWYRGYALDKEKKACETLKEALSYLKADRMVVGHTVQDNGRIQSRCSAFGHQRVYLIDVGISRAYGPAGASAIEFWHNEKDELVEAFEIHMKGKTLLI